MGIFSLFSQRCTAVVFVSISILHVFPASAMAKDSDSTFGYPLKSKVIAKEFIEPKFEYGPGHRGVSFFANIGSSVFASADGEVIFAGKVAGVLHVTVSHGKDFKSTYTNLATKTVRLGDDIRKGQLLGTVGLGKSIDGNNTFLFTMRHKAKYVDPMKYLDSELIVREIRLGEFPKYSSPSLKSISRIEFKTINSLLDSIDPDKRLQKFFEKFVGQGLDNLERGLGKSTKAYEKAIDTINEMKDLVEKINSGIDDGAEKLKSLEKKLINHLEQAFKELKELSQEIAKQYARALELGSETAIWYLETMADVITLPFEMATNLSLLVHDLIISAGNTTLKILDQYATYDIPTIMRTILIPGSCIFATCSKSIILKCNPKAKFKVRSKSDGYKGSGNSLLVIAGLGTSGDILENGKLESTLNMPVEALGYDKSEVQYFSYSGKSQGYQDTDTYKDLDLAAKSLDAHVRDFKIKNPGQKLDLTTHSLGGAVASIWLAKYYDPLDVAYPKIGKVTLLAPPLNGTALATGREILESQKDSKTVIENIGKMVPRATSESVAQVGENGEVAELVNREKPLSKVEVQTIRLAPDLIVTAATKSAPGANEITLPSNDLLNSHSGITNDNRAIATMQHFLEGSKPPCPTIADSGKSIVQASVVRSSEIFISRSIRDWADTNNLASINDFVDSMAS